MVCVCSGCKREYDTERGLAWHQHLCEDFLNEDVATHTIPNALEIFERKKARKRRKLEDSRSQTRDVHSEQV